MPRMEDTAIDNAMSRPKQELARQLVEANTEIERLQAEVDRLLIDRDYWRRRSETPA